ncbi:hypothetical protein EJ04DRAFT_492079 [Polyplosphaeria fusca]|uniref:SSD domain-containing protein n=1 Tax=Polyplosphaeria fusca TaxID=682080 RepID=A0A9P4V0F0_9PLEO|nr:hypothetical protein EJ04DRAFT_492079 [Polyplosphaeria fusca]
MIWYILYPFRGTTEPPKLLPSHPIRRAFQAHGTATARHWLLSILLTIAISVLLCYPALFQTDSPAATGLRNLPKHVWTWTTEIDDDRPADVDVRQVWVHGDYMNAIDRRVLREALTVQDALIGRGFDIGSVGDSSTPGTKFTWGLHSPLMYWNSSWEAIQDDPTPLATINAESGKRSKLNLTLRPSTVFAGKSFVNKKIRAADALVITLFDQTNSTLGAVWDSRSRQLSEELATDWSMFPPNGNVFRSRLYEFRFKPMTLNDDIFLAGSYMLTAAYVIWRMMQLRAVKSWFGLLVTICAKMTVCVIGSFTLCTYLGIDLARIPRPWFPGVVFCFGLGNIFRLINVVLETPPEMPPAQRIGHAIGEVGHLSLAVAGQNLFIIWLCSKIVTPWVADFCVFAAVTLVLDFVYHLTFFVAVLSVDVQRMELQDSLERVDLNQVSKPKTARPERQSWLGGLLKGQVPLSTRFAGTAAILSIIVALNTHYFDNPGHHLSVRGTVDSLLRRKEKREVAASQIWNPPPIYQARTPAEWLRIQDHNTAREMLSFIKPNAHSFVARVYDPLLVVLRDANGRDTSQKLVRTFAESIRHFSKEHAFPAALMVVLLIAVVTLLTNYLLWSGLPDTVEDEEDEEALFTVSTLATPQTLDIARIASCGKGHVVSISLGRSTSIWLYERGRGYSNTLLKTAAMKPKLWPIVACALDDSGSLLAICTDGGLIGTWSFAAARFLHFTNIELRGQAPTLFSFAIIHGIDSDRLSIIVLTPDGSLVEVDARSGIHQSKWVSPSSILSATLYSTSKEDMNLVFVNKSGEVHILPLREEGQWSSEVVAGLDPGPPPGSNPSKIKCVYPVPNLGLIFAIRDEGVEIFDFNTRALVHQIQIGHAKPQTFRVLHSPRRSCPCGAPAVHSLTVAYTEQDTNHMIMQTFTIDDTLSSQICLGKSSDGAACTGVDCAKEAVHCVEPAGVWESTSVLSIVGVRKSSRFPIPSSTASGVDEDYYSSEGSALKLRATNPCEPAAAGLSSSLPTFSSSTLPPASPADFETWEAWTLSTTGEFRTRPLVEDELLDDPVHAGQLEEQLFVASAGPIVKLGKRSVAVGFGNMVKVLTLGKETFDGGTGGDDVLDLGLGAYKWRRGRGGGRKAQ